MGNDKPTEAYHPIQYDYATKFDAFLQRQVAKDMRCCESPIPVVEMCQLPDKEMEFSGYCKSCRDEFGGVVGMTVSVATESQLE